MPNHITNVIRVKEAAGIATADIQSKILNDKRHVDFNVMCSMPDCLKDFEPDSQIVNIAYEMLKIPCSGIALIAILESQNRMRDFASYEGLPDERKAMVQRCLDNHKQCGYVYWYDFTNDKWGTKWNAYDQPKEGFDSNCIEFRFQTAWSHPSGLIEIFSKQLPDVTFEILYADEVWDPTAGFIPLKMVKLLKWILPQGGASNQKIKNGNTKNSLLRFATLMKTAEVTATTRTLITAMIFMMNGRNPERQRINHGQAPQA